MKDQLALFDLPAPEPVDPEPTSQDRDDMAACVDEAIVGLVRDGTIRPEMRGLRLVGEKP